MKLPKFKKLVMAASIVALGAFIPIMDALPAGSVTPHTAKPKVAQPIPLYIQCSPAVGTILSTTATGEQRAWMPTNVSGSTVAGPGVVSLSVTKDSVTNYSVSANFSYSISDLITSANTNFGVTLGQSSSISQDWSYSLNVPAGITAGIQQYKEASDLSFKAVSEVQLSPTSCGTLTSTSTGGNFLPFKSTAANTFCYALVSTIPNRTATIQVNSGCSPNI